MEPKDMTIADLRATIALKRPSKNLPKAMAKSELVCILLEIEGQDIRQIRQAALNRDFGENHSAYDDRDQRLRLLESQAWHIANNMSGLVHAREDLRCIKEAGARFLRVYEAYENRHELGAGLGIVSETDVREAFFEMMATIAHASLPEITSTDMHVLRDALSAENYNVTLAYQGREPATKEAKTRAKRDKDAQIPPGAIRNVKFRRNT